MMLWIRSICCKVFNNDGSRLFVEKSSVLKGLVLSKLAFYGCLFELRLWIGHTMARTRSRIVPRRDLFVDARCQSDRRVAG